VMLYGHKGEGVPIRPYAVCEINVNVVLAIVHVKICSTFG